MKITVVWTAFLAISLSGWLSAQQKPTQAPAVVKDLGTTESADQQFIIHGSDRLTRSRLLKLAEELSDEVEEILGEWRPKHPIVMELYGQSGQAVPQRSISRKLYKTPAGYRFQLNLHLGRGIHVPKTLHTVLELMLLERSLKETPPDVLPESLRIPRWLNEGLMETIAWRDKKADRDFYAALFQAGSFFSVEEILNQGSLENLDAGSRLAYQASAGIFVQSLLAQSQGKKSLNSLLKELPAHGGEQSILLRKHFPGLNLSAKSLLKWWHLQLAKMSEPPVTKLMSLIETEENLQKILVFQFHHPEVGFLVYEPDSFVKILDLPVEQRRRVIRPVTDQLSLLAYRAFPNHRPLISAYVVTLSQLANHPRKSKNQDTELLLQRATTTFNNLSKERALMKHTGYRVRDYLDWYQIISAQNLSGEFSDYLRLMEELEHHTSGKKNRSPMSSYLDKMEQLYSPTGK